MALTVTSPAEDGDLAEEVASPRLIISSTLPHQDRLDSVIPREGIRKLLKEPNLHDYLLHFAVGVLHLDDDEYKALIQINDLAGSASNKPFEINTSRYYVAAEIDIIRPQNPFDGEVSHVHSVRGLLLEGWRLSDYRYIGGPSMSRRGDNAIESILKLRNLRSLDLYGSQVSDAGVNRLVEGLEHLEALYLPYTTTASGLKAAFQSKTISELSVYDCMELRLGDLEDHENPERIKILDLRQIQSRSGEFSVLDRFVNLEVLDLTAHPVTDSDLAELTSIHSLRVLALGGSQVSAPSTWPASLRGGIQYLDLGGCELSEVSDWSVLFPKLQHLSLP